MSPSGPGAGEWAYQFLEGDYGEDIVSPIATDGDQVVVAMVTGDGAITGFSTDDRGEFQKGEQTETGIRYLDLGGIAPMGDGWLALGSGGRPDDDDVRHELSAFYSDDGRTWSEVEAEGLEGPADVMGLEAHDGGVVAVGTLRTADDPSDGGFRPVAWTSEDGLEWQTLRLPTGDGTEGTVTGVADTGMELLAVGVVDQSGAMWSSTDVGASWELVEREGVPRTWALDGIGRQGDVLALSGSAPTGETGDVETVEVLLRSTDGGNSWTDSAEPPPSSGGLGYGPPVVSGGNRFFTLNASRIQPWSSSQACYADIDFCRQDMIVALYASDDADRWNRIDTSGIGDGNDGEVHNIVATDDGDVFAVRRVVDGLGVWTWPGDVPLPTEEEPAVPVSDIDLLEEGDVPELGRRYALPMYIHCGMDWLGVGGEAWQRNDDGPSAETGAGDTIPEGWPVANQTIYGFVTLVSDDLIEYSIGDGEVIATYEPATEGPPGCA
ncbi:MAG: hypothetical protein R3A49_07865 [Acidimicrobiia bacterium]